MTPGHPDAQDQTRDDTLCAEHRDGKPGAPHEWRRGRRGHTVLVVCHPSAAS